MRLTSELSGKQIKQVKEMIDKEAAEKLMAPHSEEEIASSYEKRDALAAVEGTEVVGHISLIHWQKCVEIVALIVKKGYRKRGTGKLLFAKISKLAGDKYPDKQLIVLANDVSSKIALQCGFSPEKKTNIHSDVWGLCCDCKEFKSFPNCHCLPLVQKELKILRIYNWNHDLIEKIAREYCEIWRESPWCEDFWTIDMVTSDIQEHFKSSKSLIVAAVREGNVVGFSWGNALDKVGLSEVSSGANLNFAFNGHKEIFYVHELGVSKHEREKGVGFLLMQNLIANAKLLNGMENFCLRTDEKAIAARKLYEKMGFCDLGIKDGKHTSRTYWLL